MEVGSATRWHPKEIKLRDRVDIVADRTRRQAAVDDLGAKRTKNNNLKNEK